MYGNARSNTSNEKLARKKMHKHQIDWQSSPDPTKAEPCFFNELGEHIMGEAGRVMTEQALPPTGAVSSTKLRRTRQNPASGHGSKGEGRRAKRARNDLPAPIGANGRPIVLANVKYSVDVVALKAYAATEEAGRTKACNRDNEARSECTERELINRFLQHVVPTASGDGLCTVSYTRCEIGQALVEAGFLANARLYPDSWPAVVRNSIG